MLSVLPQETDERPVFSSRNGDSKSDFRNAPLPQIGLERPGTVGPIPGIQPCRPRIKTTINDYMTLADPPVIANNYSLADVAPLGVAPTFTAAKMPLWTQQSMQYELPSRPGRNLIIAGGSKSRPCPPGCVIPNGGSNMKPSSNVMRAVLEPLLIVAPSTETMLLSNVTAGGPRPVTAGELSHNERLDLAGRPHPRRFQVPPLQMKSPTAAARDENDVYPEVNVDQASVDSKPLSVMVEGAMVNRALSELSWGRYIWNATLWLAARSEAARSSQQTRNLKALFQCVRQHTDQVIKQGYYDVNHQGGRVHLDMTINVANRTKWFGRENVQFNPKHMEEFARSDRGIPPPAIVCDGNPLDVVIALRKSGGLEGQREGTPRPIVLVVEVTDFDKSGGVDLERLVATNPHCFALRSDFARFAEAARVQLRDGRVTLKQHLEAKDDPYVFICYDVTLFRGSREEGFPFLAEPIKIHVIVTGMTETRPGVKMKKNGDDREEWYQNEIDHTSLLDRLNLIGLTALETATEQRPVLITGSFPKHPREAVANSFKQWRRCFTSRFHSVFICTGGDGVKENKSALVIDGVMNKQVYHAAEDDKLVKKVTLWHWNPGEIRMSVNRRGMEAVAHKISHKKGRGSPKPGAKMEKRRGSIQKGEYTQRTSERERRSIVDMLTHTMRNSIKSEERGMISDSEDEEDEEEDDEEDDIEEDDLEEEETQVESDLHHQESICGFHFDPSASTSKFKPDDNAFQSVKKHLHHHDHNDHHDHDSSKSAHKGHRHRHNHDDQDSDHSSNVSSHHNSRGHQGHGHNRHHEHGHNRHVEDGDQHQHKHGHSPRSHVSDDSQAAQDQLQDGDNPENAADAVARPKLRASKSINFPVINRGDELKDQRVAFGEEEAVPYEETSPKSNGGSTVASAKDAEPDADYVSELPTPRRLNRTNSLIAPASESIRRKSRDLGGDVMGLHMHRKKTIDIGALTLMVQSQQMADAKASADGNPEHVASRIGSRRATESQETLLQVRSEMRKELQTKKAAPEKEPDMNRGHRRSRIMDHLDQLQFNSNSTNKSKSDDGIEDSPPMTAANSESCKWRSSDLLEDLEKQEKAEQEQEAERVEEPQHCKAVEVTLEAEADEEALEAQGTTEGRPLTASSVSEKSEMYDDTAAKEKKSVKGCTWGDSTIVQIGDKNSKRPNWVRKFQAQPNSGGAGKLSLASKMRPSFGTGLSGDRPTSASRNSIMQEDANATAGRKSMPACPMDQPSSSITATRRSMPGALDQVTSITNKRASAPGIVPKPRDSRVSLRASFFTGRPSSAKHQEGDDSEDIDALAAKLEERILVRKDPKVASLQKEAQKKENRRASLLAIEQMHAEMAADAGENEGAESRDVAESESTSLSACADRAEALNNEALQSLPSTVSRGSCPVIMDSGTSPVIMEDDICSQASGSSSRAPKTKKLSLFDAQMRRHKKMAKSQQDAGGRRTSHFAALGERVWDF